MLCDNVLRLEDIVANDASHIADIIDRCVKRVQKAGNVFEVGVLNLLSVETLLTDAARRRGRVWTAVTSHGRTLHVSARQFGGY